MNETKAEDVELFYAWECVSLIRKQFTTFDIVVRDMTELLCLIHVVHKHVYNPKYEDDHEPDYEKSKAKNVEELEDNPFLLEHLK